MYPRCQRRPPRPQLPVIHRSPSVRAAVTHERPSARRWWKVREQIVHHWSGFSLRLSVAEDGTATMLDEFAALVKALQIADRLHPEAMPPTSGGVNGRPPPTLDVGEGADPMETAANSLRERAGASVLLVVSPRVRSRAVSTGLVRFERNLNHALPARAGTWVPFARESRQFLKRVTASGGAR